ncbi:MAG: arginine N-succinyltransferase [Hyphomonadaceae bacterium]|nr:arginine N-succinyltransferase [Hyphomonadaceae bacterium]
MKAQAPLEPEYVIRAVRGGDLAGYVALRELAGPGFTSLMIEDAAFAKRIAAAEASFASDVSAPGAERYMLALEHLQSGALCGSAAVRATVGASPPFFNFRVLTIAQASAAADRRFDMSVLILVNEFTGCSEVGSLFLRPEHRKSGVGRALAQARYMLIAAAPQRFNERLVSEMRGVVAADGTSPFWEALGAHFFKMSFREADQLSATTDNQFILDLMPKYPIYADLLPAPARAAIGVCHPDGAGARKLLEWEGFRYDHVVDIFDGGPLLTVSRDAVRTKREAGLKRLVADASPPRPVSALVATPETKGFRCVSVGAAVRGDEARVHPKAIAALGLDNGAEALVWASSNES